MSRSASSSRKPLLICAGVALASVAFGYVSWQATSAKDTPATNPAAASAPEAAAATEGNAELLRLARRESGDKLAVGRADAPVVLIEYSDFKCGYCGKFARDTEPELMKKYVEDGTLRIEWRNFPIFGADSEAAAKAAWAAGQQDRFAQFHAAAYAEGSKEKGFGEARLLELAEQAGVPDLERFKKDMAGESAAEALRKDQEEGYRIGVSSTPSFLVNDRPIAGAQPLDAFVSAIAKAKAQAQAAGAAGAAKK
ncbi:MULTISPECIES: thioredoxin domain-containing protein [unclassified Streptomyces]|uniref:DsbA family protein n=1 Tax=unclassified Streptomyces TaxID=2593676 RepID=UPI002254C59D|nr:MULTISPECIES: thioredoxin domain-containing protein [unclassified Streptomyces]MCX4526661.1 thioredoxin domain-containing protein [Streptomyces sp. NBC_01551]MCX4542777.1 thioredoxin domain-containing protein [Streptomyces sp. NBC_01565]